MAVTPLQTLSRLGEKSTEDVQHRVRQQKEQFSYDDILLLSHKNIFQLATGTKEESMKLQDIVSYCCVRVLFRIQQAALIKLDELTVHPSGTYLIQGLALKSTDFRQTAI